MTPEQLKASILQYAMEGKLVKQDPADMPASELLKKIKAAKDQLIKEKKIKTNIKLPDITDDEKTFEIPDSWEWVRLENVGFITSGGTPSKAKPTFWNSNDFPWITPKLLGENKGKVLLKEESLDANSYISKEGLEHSSAQIVPANSIVYSSRAPIGYLNIMKFDYTTNQGAKSLTPIETNINFLYYALIQQTPNIIKRASGTTFKEISGTKFKQSVIPLPPLDEQKRIVAKIEQIMPLVDQYDLAYNRLKEIDNSFNDKMKQSILQYAMEGKLVEQDPTDVPASELLKTISAEKAQLIKEKKIKRSKKMPEITQEEKPFKIPTSWEWVRLGNLVDILSGRDLPKANHLSSQVPKSIPYITGASNISDNQLQITTWTSDPITIAKRGDILLTVKGTIGKIAILDMSQAHIARQLMALTILSNNISKEYLIIFLNWYVFSLKEKARSIIPGVSRQDVEKGLVPFPPLDEQKRIVAKINSLFQKL